MKSKNYSILTDNDSMHLMCISPRAKCELASTFQDLVNIETMTTQTPDNVVVHRMKVCGTPCEIKDCIGTVVDLTRQICDDCQKQR